MLSLVSILVMLGPGIDTVTFRADRLEWHDGLIKIDGAFTLKTKSLSVDGRDLTQRRSLSCKDPVYVSQSPLILRSQQGYLTAGKASYCETNRHFLAQDIRLKSAIFTMTARSVAGQFNAGSRLGTFTLHNAQFSACGCEEPPWRVTAGQARVNLQSGSWLSWPVFWLGHVPIATVPFWYIPLGERRSGLLLPEVSWRNENRFQFLIPVYLALSDTAALELAPGFRGRMKPVTRSHLRWSTPSNQSNFIQLDTVEKLSRIWGRGFHEMGRLQLFVDGEALTEPTQRYQLTTDWQVNKRRHSSGRVSAKFTTDNLIGFAHGLIVQDAFHNGTLPEDSAQNPIIAGFGVWSQLGTITLGTTMKETLIWHPVHQYIHRLSFNPQMDVRWWLGLFQFDAFAKGLGVGLSGEHQVNPLDDHRLEGRAGLGIKLGVVGRGHGIVHRSTVGVSGRISELHQAGMDTDDTLWLPGFNERSVRVEWANMWAGSSALVNARLSYGYDWAYAPQYWRPLNVQLSWQHPSARFWGQWVGREYQSAYLRLGQLSSVYLASGFTHLSPDVERGDWLRREDGDGTFRQSFLGEGLATVTPGFGSRWAFVGLEWSGAIGLDTRRLIGHSGSVRWFGSCRCWSMALNASHEISPRRLRFFLSFRLSPLDPESAKAQ